jgi:NAD-dependent dihydropyrimidine dehydrogenase PreA subunit
MAYAVDSSCIGCGACEFVCPHGAISQSEGYPVIYVVDPLRCDDCALCVPVCPLSALAPDPDWAARYAGWECSVGERRCDVCGSMLWRKSTDADWVCSRCRLGEGGHGASCPKVRREEALALATRHS